MQHATIQRVSSTIRSGAGQHTASIITPASFLCHPFASLLSSSLSTPAPSYTNNLKHSLYTLTITMTDEYFPDSDSELTPQSESESEGSDCTDNGDGTNLGNGGVQAGNGGDDGGGGEANNREEEGQPTGDEQAYGNEDNEDDDIIPMPKGPMFVLRKSHRTVPHPFQSKEANDTCKEKVKKRPKIVSSYLLFRLYLFE